ncbi:MAG: hypothetical protein OXI70_12465 [Chloroflexota bacterium]|nr:hypothetical protein [Chloroflexota bacterium]
MSRLRLSGEVVNSFLLAIHTTRRLTLFLRVVYSQRTVPSAGWWAVRIALNSCQVRTAASGRDRLSTTKSDSGEH